MDATLRKQQGVHYTPPELAGFLARQTAACCHRPASNRMTVLDPACGAGELLAALVEALRSLPSFINVEISVVGFETNPLAVEQTVQRLEPFRLTDLQIRNEDFLGSDSSGDFDCVIANPPYVRTQVLGGPAAQELARKFNLNGRVDLYQAFAVAISQSLRPGGALGLLTSNRFLTVKSGLAMRQLLSTNFDLKQIFDLGDTRLFDAAVLPVVLTAVKKSEPSEPPTTLPEFHRIYRVESLINSSSEFQNVLDAIDNPDVSGEVETTEGRFLIERGELLAKDQQSVWNLANSKTRKWLGQIRSHQSKCFGDLAEIKVGIKTTADAVFIRDDWESLGKTKPESRLLLPLITHHDACRWTIDQPGKQVLYPYDLARQKRTPIEQGGFPKTVAYFEQHRDRLEGRKYVVESGRHWYEIWVPHQPADWANPKLVWPDISEQPKFFLDSSGAIVNGDCYWIKLRPGVDPDWLYLMLAVANSTIATKFYDTVFHNKLYAGRRRFMTQYVNEFPLPDLASEVAAKIVKVVQRLVGNPATRDEARVEALVRQSFGF